MKGLFEREGFEASYDEFLRHLRAGHVEEITLADDYHTGFMDIPEGEHKVSCLAQDASGAEVLLGEFPVKVFPHAVTILSMDWYPGVE